GEGRARPAADPRKAPAARRGRGAPAEKPAARPVVSAGTPGVCTARVITEPKDAKVIWDGKEIGHSPIDGQQVPCGAAKVMIERDRWQPVTVDVNLRAGDAAVVRERLHRPHGPLIVNSSPGGPQVSINHV